MVLERACECFLSDSSKSILELPNQRPSRVCRIRRATTPTIGKPTHFLSPRRSMNNRNDNNNHHCPPPCHDDLIYRRPPLPRPVTCCIRTRHPPRAQLDNARKSTPSVADEPVIVVELDRQRFAALDGGAADDSRAKSIGAFDRRRAEPPPIRQAVAVDCN